MEQKEKKQVFSLRKAVFIGMMAAVVYVVSMLRFPFLGSKLHFGNTMCLLAGLLFGPIPGGLSAGIGSLIVDMTSGYPFWEGIITFVSKFAMGAIAGLCGAFYRKKELPRGLRVGTVVGGSVSGALSYMLLYMLKHFVLQLFVYRSEWNAMLTVLASKLPASAINAGFAIVCAPIFFFAIYPILMKLSVYRREFDREETGKKEEE